ncbi:MAG: hypothetical protein FE78DRAFT_80676 [Acidomyces sp. 'richmondensis']|nr:MAG: hypothetical protein FE78DRAFT_80676 [Acidomyces sp. 'richmondensis']
MCQFFIQDFRLITLEHTTKYSLPVSDFPSETACLPFDLSEGTGHEGVTFAPNTITQLSDFHAPEIGNFGRQAQAIYLQGRVEKALPVSCADAKLTELRRRDHPVRGLLCLILDGYKANSGPLGIAIATCVRYAVQNAVSNTITPLTRWGI